MKPRHLPAALLVLTALCTPPLWAQSEDWYRVELLVFRQGGPGAATQERWPAEPHLRYPGTQRFLVYPERVAQRAAAHPGTHSEVDAYGRQMITPSDPDTAPVEEIPRRDPAGGAPVGEAPPAAGADLPETEAPPPRPEPFVARPASEREFAGKAAYMERRGNYRVLFHETWLQRLDGPDQVTPLVLDDSGATGQYPELQGSIKLYLDRYLQVETNLWLNTEGEYLPGDWRMPAPPLGPSSLVVETPEPTEPATTWTLAEPVEGEALTEAEESGPLYPFRHAVLLQQSRRMRSGEVHYLDHPMLGVIIKLTPLSEEVLESLAPPPETQAAQAAVPPAWE
jgi:Peptidoglycan-binding protein, CsiV